MHKDAVEYLLSLFVILKTYVPLSFSLDVCLFKMVI